MINDDILDKPIAPVLKHFISNAEAQKMKEVIEKVKIRTPDRHTLETIVNGSSEGTHIAFTLKAHIDNMLKALHDDEMKVFFEDRSNIESNAFMKVRDFYFSLIENIPVIELGIEEMTNVLLMIYVFLTMSKAEQIEFGANNKTFRHLFQNTNFSVEDVFTKDFISPKAAPKYLVSILCTLWNLFNLSDENIKNFKDYEIDLMNTINDAMTIYRKEELTYHKSINSLKQGFIRDKVKKNL